MTEPKTLAEAVLLLRTTVITEPQASFGSRDERSLTALAAGGEAVLTRPFSFKDSAALDIGVEGGSRTSRDLSDSELDDFPSANDLGVDIAEVG